MGPWRGGNSSTLLNIARITQVGPGIVVHYVPRRSLVSLRTYIDSGKQCIWSADFTTYASQERLREINSKCNYLVYNNIILPAKSLSKAFSGVQWEAAF
jgi:hypothetical protein